MAAHTVNKAEHAPTGSYAKEVLPRVEDLAASYRDWLKTYVNDTKKDFWRLSACTVRQMGDRFSQSARKGYWPPTPLSYAVHILSSHEGSVVHFAFGI